MTNPFPLRTSSCLMKSSAQCVTQGRSSATLEAAAPPPLPLMLRGACSTGLLLQQNQMLAVIRFAFTPLGSRLGARLLPLHHKPGGSPDPALSLWPSSGGWRTDSQNGLTHPDTVTCGTRALGARQMWW